MAGIFCHCYLRKGVVYIPTAGMVSQGHYRLIEPVAVVPVADAEGLRKAFRETLARGNPPLPKDHYKLAPKPLMPKYAGVKTLAAFDRGVSTWDIKDKDGLFQILGYRQRPDRGWERDPEQAVELPPGSTVDDVIERMIAILQAKAKE